MSPEMSEIDRTKRILAMPYQMGCICVLSKHRCQLKLPGPHLRDPSKACFHGCCPAPFLSLLEAHHSTPMPRSSSTTSCGHFTAAVASSLHPNSQFTNHESLPSLEESFSIFNSVFTQHREIDRVDHIRAQEYYHLSSSKKVCLDYIGHGLFSYSQQVSHCNTISAPSKSSSPPAVHSNASNVPFFDILYKSVNLKSQIWCGGQESEFESKIKKRIMSFMNISEDNYSLVFTVNQSSAFKLLADSYPFQLNQSLLTVYDYKNEAEDAMIKSARRRGARVLSAEFSWPSLSIQSGKLRKLLACKREKRNRGLFVFPLRSRITGARYSHLWMSLARENGWHVLFDACALGAKEMHTLGLSLFQPDFLICSFFKVFGENPSGFGCLFVKKSSASLFGDSSTATSLGTVSLIPATGPSQPPGKLANTQQELGQPSEPKIDLARPSSASTSMSVQQSSIQETEEEPVKQMQSTVSEIVESEKPLQSAQSRATETSTVGSSEIECRGLDHVDSLGLILISCKARYLVNWLINALMSLQHPHSEKRLPLITIYGPKIQFDRGPAVAFNIFDWKGEKVDPHLVQKLADRSNISLSYGFLRHIWLSHRNEDQRERTTLETRKTEGKVGNKRTENADAGISVVTVCLGFLTNFEDVYRLWAFVSCFLDADFVEKERWRYKTLNQITCEV